ncbi:MAG: glycosyltransferase family 2 protein [Planctomycetota bacterium]
MSDRPTITAAIIALDEAENLAELLPRLDWVDEIVVVDGESADATAAVARSHGCRVSVRLLDTFARQRNHALALATGEWVLSIDADERPGTRLAAEVQRETERARYAGFRIPIRSSIFGRTFRASGTQDDCPVRLVRREAAHWVGSVHEQLRVSGGVGRLQGWLRHQTLPDLDAFLAKMHRYTMLEARARVEAARRPRRRDAWIQPAREVFRRLVWKRGFLDGPEGWAFCFLSGLSEWVLAERHRRLWQSAQPTAPAGPGNCVTPARSASEGRWRARDVPRWRFGLVSTNRESLESLGDGP